MSRRFSTQEHCRLALQWLWKEIESDSPTMPIQKAKTLVYIALSISQILKESDLEVRIAQLEAVHASRNQRRVA